jgi:hypothetical protein
MLKFLLTSALAIFGGAHAVGADEAVSSSFYDSMPLPTHAENESLERAAKKHGIDLLATLHELPDDPKLWSKIFSVSVEFGTFDRSAQVYGYYVFTSWLYFVSSAGVDSYAKLVESQPVAVRQRIRDLIYVDVVMGPKELRDVREKELRAKCRTLFPSDYVFGKDDALFKGLTRR